MPVSIRSLWTLSRPGNVFITALSVIIGGQLATRTWFFDSGNLWIAALAAALIAAGGNAYNDYCDRDLDRLQKPQRPLPSGQISPRAARNWAMVCLALGIALSLLLSPLCSLIASSAALLLVLYSRYFKGAPLLGNIVVALVAGLAFIFGAAAIGFARSALWAAWLAFCYHLAREIIKDMEDFSGDRAAGARTLPVRYGLRVGRWVTSLVLLVLLVSLPLPHFLTNYKIYYLAVVLSGVLPVLLAVAILQWFWSQPPQFHRLSSWLKWDMLVGLCALLIGKPDL
ncbi:MAG TPA: geranylgeranylglycerol-phosphate geranylgeranyltransferase [bacterium]